MLYIKFQFQYYSEFSFVKSVLYASVRASIIVRFIEKFSDNHEIWADLHSVCRNFFNQIYVFIQ